MQGSVGEERGMEHALEERIRFAVITLGIYTLLCVFSPSTFKTKVSLD